MFNIKRPNDDLIKNLFQEIDPLYILKSRVGIIKFMDGTIITDVYTSIEIIYSIRNNKPYIVLGFIKPDIISIKLSECRRYNIMIQCSLISNKIYSMSREKFIQCVENTNDSFIINLPLKF